jgi:hypothetical protein
MIDNSWVGDPVKSIGGSVGGGSVSVGVAAKIAVWVRLGVGNVNGVGEAAPGSVHPLKKSSVAAIKNWKIRARIATSAE